MNTIHAIEVIASDPEIRNGRPYLLGTTVTVADVVIAHLYHNKDAGGIAEWYGLELHQVHAALSYYYAHKPAMDDEIRTQIRKSEELTEKRVGSRHSLLP